MPLGTEPQQILDDTCTCTSFLSQQCDIVTSKVTPLLCYGAPFPVTVTNPQSTVVTQANTAPVCPVLTAWPGVGGQSLSSLSFNINTFPFRVALDEKALQIPINGRFTALENPATSLDRNCNANLNGFFPGCSKTAGGGACNWQPVVLGKFRTDQTIYANADYDSCGGSFNVEVPSFLDTGTYSCLIAASFCARTAFDYTYKPACCKQTLQTDFGLSQSIWLTNTFWKYRNSMRLGGSSPNDQFILPLESKSFNPYELYCDPTWCPNSAACDNVYFDECQYSTTTVGTSTLHACLASTGACRAWFSASTLVPTPETALLVGSHNWLLLDRMMQNYCLNSASALGDTTSCACIGYGKASVERPGDTLYYVSCSTVNIATNCPNGVVPVVPIDGSPTLPLTGGPRILTDPVCANIDCLASRADGSRFLTSGALQRALACPRQICLLANMNSTFNFGNIGTGTRLISNDSQFCLDTSFTNNAPSFRLVTAPTIWFYTNVGQSITNPNQSSILRIENVSNDENTNMRWSVSWNGAPAGGLPPWLTFQGVTSGEGVFPGQATSVQWNLGTVTQTPAYFDLSVTVHMLGDAQGVTFSKQDLLLNFAIIDIDKKEPSAPSGTDNAPNGLQLNVTEKLSPGSIATIVLVVLLILVALGVLFQAWRTSTLVRKAQFWNAWN